LQLTEILVILVVVATNGFGTPGIPIIVTLLWTNASGRLTVCGRDTSRSEGANSVLTRIFDIYE